MIDPDGRDGCHVTFGCARELKANGARGRQKIREAVGDNVRPSAGETAVLGVMSLAVPGPEDAAVGVFLAKGGANLLGKAGNFLKGLFGQSGRGKQVGNSINTDGTTTATEIIQKSEDVGFTQSQSGNGPLKMVDENGVPRVTIKSGSSRTPGSEGPHVELRDSNGQRVNPQGEPVTRRSPENHTPIIDDRGQ